MQGISQYDALDEPLRVLYVAATRARRLLAFALSDGDVRRVAHLLRQRGIRYGVGGDPGAADAGAQPLPLAWPQ